MKVIARVVPKAFFFFACLFVFIFVNGCATSKLLQPETFNQAKEFRKTEVKGTDVYEYSKQKCFSYSYNTKPKAIVIAQKGLVLPF